MRRARRIVEQKKRGRTRVRPLDRDGSSDPTRRTPARPAASRSRVLDAVRRGRGHFDVAALGVLLVGCRDFEGPMLRRRQVHTLGVILVQIGDEVGQRPPRVADFREEAVRAFTRDGGSRGRRGRDRSAGRRRRNGRKHQVDQLIAPVLESPLAAGLLLGQVRPARLGVDRRVVSLTPIWTRNAPLFRTSALSGRHVRRCKEQHCRLAASWWQGQGNARARRCWVSRTPCPRPPTESCRTVSVSSLRAGRCWNPRRETTKRTPAKRAFLVRLGGRKCLATLCAVPSR